MKTAKHSLTASLVAAGIALSLLAGCSKKEAPAPAPAKSTEPAKPAAPEPGVTEAIKEKATHVAAQTKETAAAVATEMKAEPQKVATEAKQMTAAAAQTVKTETTAATTALQEAGASLKSSMTAAKQEAAQADGATLLTRYSGELDMLKKNATALKAIVDQNLDKLPEGARAKYQEFNALLPNLSGLVASLTNYQNADMSTLVPRLQADFSRAQQLYTEIKAMIPADMLGGSSTATP